MIFSRACKISSPKRGKIYKTSNVSENFVVEKAPPIIEFTNVAYASSRAVIDADRRADVDDHAARELRRALGFADCHIQLRSDGRAADTEKARLFVD